MGSLQLLTLYLTLTPIFSGRKAKINLRTTPKLTVVMPNARIQEFSSGGGGGGGPRQSDKKSSDNVVFFLGFFLSPSLI